MVRDIMVQCFELKMNSSTSEHRRRVLSEAEAFVETFTPSL
jgi:hypothetical protein